MKYLHKVLSKVWRLFEYYLVKLIDYRFKSRTIFWWGIKYFSLTLAAEIICIQTELQFSSLFTWINKNWGETWEVIIRTLIDLLGAGGLGWSYLTIFIKLYLITLFCLFEWNKDKKNQFSWKWIWVWNWNWKLVFNPSLELNLIKINNYGRQFRVNEGWFESIESRQLNTIEKAKFNDDLHFPSEAEIEISKLINQNVDINIIRNHIDLLNRYNLSISFQISEIENIENRSALYTINTDSSLYAELKKHQKSYLENQEKITSLVQQLYVGKLNLSEILELELFSDNFFKSSDLTNFVSDSQFDLFRSKEGLELFTSPAIERDFFKILELYYFALRNFTSEFLELKQYLIQTIRGNHYLIDASGGIGKTHFSIGIFKKLKENGHFPIFLKGSSFSGGSVDLNLIIKNLLELSNDEQITDFFKLLNSFGIEKNRKVIFIIDGINETTYLSNGFSSVWKDGVDWLVREFAKYQNLFLIVTSRTSYLKSIDLSSIVNRAELKGFEDEVDRKEVVNNYFKEYRIIEDVENSDLSHFQFPLFLSIFCQAVNGKREVDVPINLHQLELPMAMEKMIFQISSRASFETDRPSPRPVLNAIDRNTVSFKDEISGRLTIDDFFESTDGKSIDDIFISTSIAYHLLKDETLFLKELSFSNDNISEYVVHTFQFIGGYLIAKKILTEFPLSQDLVLSPFFINHLQNSHTDYSGNTINPNSHQLAKDILKFLITAYFHERNDLINHTTDYVVQNLTWELLFENPNYIGREALIEKLNPFLVDSAGWNALLNQSLNKFLEKDSSINFQFISDGLKSLSQINSDYSWSFYVYENWYVFEEFLNDTEEMLAEIVSNGELSSEDKLRLEIVIWLLETNYRKGRDRASIILLEVGIKFPDFIFSKLIEFSTVERLYIYERLASISYGICLRLQNDSIFVNGVFKDVVPSIYSLQFGQEPTAPTYHYVVIDSLKHMVDLGVQKKIIQFTKEQQEQLEKYSFVKNEWEAPSGSTIAIFQECGYNAYTHECPDPFKMDFVIYTVPRLIEYGNEVKKSEALANIYLRLQNAGYETLEFDRDIRSKMRDFFYGSSFYTIKGKIDRLGKKYSWNAFFEYAGFLLQNEELTNIWNEYDTSNGKPAYERLGDLEFEVSNPNPSLSLITQSIFKGNLLDIKSKNQNWVTIEKHDILWEVWKTKFEEQDFTMLYGYIENKPDANYTVRSFLVIDSFLIKKSEAKEIESELNNLCIDWGRELYGSKTLTRTYFGELYWADNIPDVLPVENTVYLGTKRNVKRKLSILNIHREEEYWDKKEGDIVEEVINDQIHFNCEPTIADYLWESDRTSGAQDSYRDNIPSPQIGKYLNLKADAEKFQLLDENLDVATKSVYWENQGKDKQQMNFLRSDLLQKYMDENDFVLLYEVRQFTHDQTISENGGQVDMRKIKYLFPHLRS